MRKGNKNAGRQEHKRSPSDAAVELKKRSWHPILASDVKDHALAVVSEIVAALPDPSSAGIADPSLSRGDAGLAVLCAYLARAGLDDGENAMQFLAQAVNAVSSQTMNSSLYRGFTGIAWAVAHLQEQLVDSESDPNEAIDEALKAYLDQSPWPNDYDLINGLVGMGVYGMERCPRASAIACLERIVERLDETAESSADDVTWSTRPHLLPERQREQCPDGYYNLGLAHGVPGVIAFLGELCAAGVALEKAKPLLTAQCGGSCGTDGQPPPFLAFRPGWDLTLSEAIAGWHGVTAMPESRHRCCWLRVA